MATEAARLKKGKRLLVAKNKTTLTLTGLLMEGLGSIVWERFRSRCRILRIVGCSGVLLTVRGADLMTLRKWIAAGCCSVLLAMLGVAESSPRKDRDRNLSEKQDLSTPIRIAPPPFDPYRARNEPAPSRGNSRGATSRDRVAAPSVSEAFFRKEVHGEGLLHGRRTSARAGPRRDGGNSYCGESPAMDGARRWLFHDANHRRPSIRLGGARTNSHTPSDGPGKCFGTWLSFHVGRDPNCDCRVKRRPLDLRDDFRPRQ